MQVGEMFVKLGIKGDASATKGIDKVRGGLEDVKKMSLQAKAAIVGVVFGLQRLMTGSMQQGVALQQFANFTGMSTKALQQYQFAARQAGLQNEEITQSVVGMQSAFAQLKLNKGPQEYLGYFATTLKEIGKDFDYNKMEDAFYTMQKMREFVEGGGTGQIDIDNQILQSLGATQGMIAGFRGGAFNENILNSAQVYSDKESKALSNVNAGWVRLGETVQKAVGRMNVKFGGQLIQDLTKITESVVKLTTQLLLLSESSGAFGRLSKAIENVANLIDLVSGIAGEEGQKSSSAWGSALDEVKKNPNRFNPQQGGILGALSQLFPAGTNGVQLAQSRLDRLNAMPTPGLPNSQSGTTTFNQTLNFQNDGSNAQDVGRASRNGVLEAYQQTNTSEVRGGN